MGLGLALSLFFLLGPQQRVSGLLEVDPPSAEVAVALGGSLQLTCRLACAQPGAVASVRWWGLDTNLGAMRPGAHHSTLSVQNASLAASGTRVCMGSCGRNSFQRAVKLQVFAFPDQLSVSPMALVAGRDREVACTAHNVTPAHPEALSLSLLLGDRKLEGAQALGREEEEELQEFEGTLFRVTERWQLPPLGNPSPPALHCQATMSLPGLELTHLLPIPVLQNPTSPEPPVTTSPDGTSTQGSTHSTRPPSPTPGKSTPRPCHPHIQQLPMPGGLQLLCQAECGPGVTVRWTQIPGQLAAFEKRETGPRAWLNLPGARCSAEGWFQCRAEPGGQKASLHVVPEICSLPMPAELWVGTTALGLLLLALVTYRLWRRCRQAR
ncbi:mucosal addressin cell adhesion molecule 1 [Sorex fumeus]|uniref:mucosal addressin cell adhesion molecule 1 n=1 Tax=Sorex fumeus TaxID=62283 RepID=UPI0024ACB417|nr:mucosal addressin cell adhesion molecule 1 [Sorex fumeus]